MLSLDAANELLGLYQGMVDAARENDWDGLGELQVSAAKVRTKASSAQGAPVLTPDEQTLLATTISRILELDGEIRTHAEPARDSMRKLLSGSVKDRVVRDAYGSAAG